MQNVGKRDFCPHPPPVHMNPTLLPCIVSGGMAYSLNLWAVHPCTQGFELILGRHYLPQTKKRHFFHFCLSPGAGIIILHPPKAAFCEAGTMAHQNLKRKWGVTMLLSELPRLELAKRWKKGFLPTPPPCAYESHPVALYSIRGNIFLKFMGCTPMYTGIRVDSGTSLSAANPKNVIFSTFACLLGQE